MPFGITTEDYTKHSYDYMKDLIQCKRTPVTQIDSKVYVVQGYTLKSGKVPD